MNRKLSAAATNMVSTLAPRTGNSLDQEREEFEKAQRDAMIKCLSADEAPPKEKHVRTLIMGTYRARGPEVFWKKLEDCVSLYSSPIVTWKLLIAFHRILQDGDATVVTKSMKHASLIDEVCRSHAQVGNSSYGQLTGKYGKTIVNKLLFHNKNKFVPGNFNMKSAEIENIDAGDLFELCVDFLDEMEAMYKMMKTVFDTFELGNKSISLTNSGQCRLSAIGACVNDTSRLLELTTNVMRYLHLGLPWDTLNGHRDRFRTIHGELRKIYDSMQYIQFLRSLVQIPRLSEDISYFFETLSKMSDRSMSIEEQEEVTEFPIQTFQEEDLVSVTTDEYSDLSSKYQMVLQMLESEQQQRTLDKDAFLEKEKHMKCELEALRKSYSELSVSSVAEPSTTAGQEEKLEKLKTAYQKLRSDHIALLRQKGDIEKKLVDKSTSQDLLSSKLDATEGALKTFFLSHDIPLQEIENVPLKNKLEMIDEKMSNLQLSLVAKEALIRKLEQMRNETIITHDEKTEQLKILEEKYQKLKMFWSDQIQDRYSTTSSFLEKERNLVGGIPKKEDFFSGFNLVDNHALDQLVFETEKSLRSQDCIVSKTMGTLLQFLPYMNTVEEIDLNLVYNAASDLISKTLTATNNDGGGKIPEDSIIAFEHAINKQYELIQKSASLSSEDDVEDEIGKLFVKIDDAASTMEKLMLAARADESKKSIDVDIKILDECNHLLEVVQRLIKEARDLQTEITAESGTLNAKEFYRKNQKWSQGLISAAKDIGGGAKCLVDAADKVVSGDGKFEEIIAASQEIAGSSAQMVFASKVKAKKGSLKLEVLSGTSKLVPEKVARVIATCKYLANTENTESQVDLMALSVHQTKRLEMEVQVKVLELENMLEKEREKLFKIRRDTYNSNNQESNSND